MPSIGQRLMAAYNAFRNPGDPVDPFDAMTWDDYDSRLLRYRLNDLYYNNKAYRKVAWNVTRMTNLGLYRGVRNIYNPTRRVTEFQTAHLQGGLLDPMAGDGQQIPSALPIVTENDLLRPAIADLWRASRWQTRKSILTRNGVSFGDSFGMIIDDPANFSVYMKPIQPSWVKSIIIDDQDNVKSYELVYSVRDPDDDEKWVEYGETATRDGVNSMDVVYRTFKDDSPFGWHGDPEEWTMPYGFIPMRKIQHIDNGLMWGQSEMEAARPKIDEIENEASLLGDEIGKMVNAPFAMWGVKTPKSDIETPRTMPTQSNPRPEKDDKGYLFNLPTDGSATPLLSNLDIQSVTANIGEMLEALELDYPELRSKRWSDGNAPSGKALRAIQMEANEKMLSRRVNYDEGTVALHQMAIAIAGWRRSQDSRYSDVYRSFGLDSFKSGALEHVIGSRDVFQGDPLDDLEIEHEFVNNAKVAGEAGIPIQVYLEQRGSQNGWDDDAIKKLVESPQYQANLAQSAMAIADFDALNGAEDG